MTNILSDRELQTLRNWGNLSEEAADEIYALRAALAAQPAEPVAWRVRRHDSPKYWIIFMHKPVDALADPEREVQPLYAAQPAPAAVPLTDEQIERLRQRETPLDFSTVRSVPRPSIPPRTYIRTSVSTSGGAGQPLTTAT